MRFEGTPCSSRWFDDTSLNDSFPDTDPKNKIEFRSLQRTHINSVTKQVEISSFFKAGRLFMQKVSKENWKSTKKALLKRTGLTQFWLFMKLAAVRCLFCYGSKFTQEEGS